MKRLKVSLWTLLFLATALNLSCGKKKKTTPADTTAAGASFVNPAHGSIRMAKSFGSNTPKGMQTATSLKLTDQDYCQTQYPNDAAGSLGCEVISILKTQLFTGPGNIQGHLSEFDTALNGTLSILGEKYVPCFDTARIAAGDIAVGGGNARTMVNFPAYSLTSVPVKEAFGNGMSLDMGKTLNFSCRTGDDTNGFGAYGKKDNIWSLYNIQKSGGGNMGMVGWSDQDDNIEMWFTMGDSVRDATMDQHEKGNPGTAYPSSTGLMHIISKPKQNLTGVAWVMSGGAGSGGCGSQLLMNDTTAYLVGNINMYGKCTPTDFGNNGPGDSYVSSMDNYSLCMKVSGNAPEASPDGMNSCVASGLVALDESGKVIAPFTAAGLRYLTADTASTVADALKVRIWMASFFMRDADLSQVPQLTSVPINPEDTLEVSGYGRNTFPALRTTANTSLDTVVSAPCTADSSARQAAMNESFSLSMSTIVATMIAESGATNKPTESSILAEFAQDFARTGDQAPLFEVAINSSSGTTFHGTFSGTVTVTLDGQQVGKATLTLPTTAGEERMAATVPLSGVTLTADSVFTIGVTGTFGLSCDNAVNTKRTVSAKAGIPQLIWFTQKSAASSSGS